MALLPGSLTPSLAEDTVLLGAHMPFEQARWWLARTRGVSASEAAVRRRTEEAGAAQVRLEEAQEARIRREAPLPPPGPQRAFMSADGAMVPLLHGEWKEVRTLVVGRVQAARDAQGEPHVVELSSFSRLANAETFIERALVEVHRRGLERAGEVCAVTDGAVWEQELIDMYRPDALRILDFPHAAERLAPFAPAQSEASGLPAAPWLKGRLHALKHEGPAALLGELAELAAAHPECEGLRTNVQYLSWRQAHLQYPAFHQAGWPIGSGAMESANKTVVQARLKRAGMHWERGHVDPMLALRNVLCSDRWDQAWPQIAGQLRQQHRREARALHARHRQALAAEASPAAAPQPPSSAETPSGTPAAVGSGPPEAAAQASPRVAGSVAPSSRAVPKPGPRPPSPNHPWRRSPIGRAAEAAGLVRRGPKL